ncbi:DUF721 domain-containing protein [Candidatus Dependentiae bacterium]|nr:DUF721 domain-containing protein [Candidatus Dependentiae bacterium]
MAILLEHLIPKVLSVASEWHIRLLKDWQIIVGSLQTRICLEKVEKNIVFIGVYEYYWMQELHLLSRFIVAKINNHLGDSHVAEVRFRVIDLPKKQRLPRPAFKHEQCVVEPPALTSREQQALMKIKDEQLRCALTQFLRRCQINN